MASGLSRTLGSRSAPSLPPPSIPGAIRRGPNNTKTKATKTAHVVKRDPAEEEQYHHHHHHHHHHPPPREQQASSSSSTAVVKASSRRKCSSYAALLPAVARTPSRPFSSQTAPIARPRRSSTTPSSKKGSSESRGHTPAEEPVEPLNRGQWENELARSILVLYANATATDAELAGQNFAIDADEVRCARPDDPMAKRPAVVPPVVAGTMKNKKKEASSSSTFEAGFVYPDEAAADEAREGKRKVVAPLFAAKVRPIWFQGSGSIDADWSQLPNGDERWRDIGAFFDSPSPSTLRHLAETAGEEKGWEDREEKATPLLGEDDITEDLGALEEAAAYDDYISVVEQALEVYTRRAEETTPDDYDVASGLWRQLALTANIFGVRCVEKQDLAAALRLFKKTQALAACPELLSAAEMGELRGFSDSSHAYYYFRRNKCHAALSYAAKAMKVHHRHESWPHVAKCHLHSGAVLSRLGKHAEAVRCLGQVLHLVQAGKLDVGGAAPQKLCLVAVAYHNLAVEQIYLNRLAEAVVSAQNARRLARLCLSYSNRWLHHFEGAHKCASQLLNQATLAQHHQDSRPRRERRQVVPR